MPVNDNIGKRMKGYEYVTRTHLIRRTPAIIRVDGKAFHTFTRGFKRPFDGALVAAMQRTMQFLCEGIQGCVMGYTQSDEISLLLVDYKKLDTAAWFDYNIQKCASVAASMATLEFNRAFWEEYYSWFVSAISGGLSDEDRAYKDALDRAEGTGAMFDARVFNLPKEEVCNYFYWRQIDAVRNSIQMVGQAHFSHGQLHGKSCDEIQEMLFQQCGVNWNDTPTHLKRGSACVRKVFADVPSRPKWVVDTDIPMFVSDGRQYIDNLVNGGETDHECD